jgi:hypothetical protein
VVSACSGDGLPTDPPKTITKVTQGAPDEPTSLI